MSDSSTEGRLATLFKRHEEGRVTVVELDRRFLDLLLELSSDEDRLRQCESLPDWYRARLTEMIEEWADMDFYVRVIPLSYPISNDPHIGEKIQLELEQVALRRQQMLKRLAPKMMTILQNSFG